MADSCGQHIVGPRKYLAYLKADTLALINKWETCDKRIALVGYSGDA